MELSRRNILQTLALASFTRLQLPAATPGAPLFFSKDQFATLDTLTELIIPTDAHSPGARQAGVAVYIDKSVAEAFAAEDKESWTKGLAAIDALARTHHDAAFNALKQEQQIALLSELAAKENDPKDGAEKFFGQLKETTAFVYYSSSIGIHQDIEYKGNVLLEQFVGYDAT